MARFDLYPNPEPSERSHTPYVLDVQNDHLLPLETRVVIPLRAAKTFGPTMTTLNPVFDVDGKSLVLDTASLAPIPSAWLRKPSLHADRWRADVLDALDALFGSY